MAANDDEKRTLWCGNLSEKVHQKLLHELFLQAGPLERVNIPKEKDGRQKNYGFIVYVHQESVPYALELFRGTSLYQKTLNLQSKGNSRLEKVSSYDIIARDIPPQFNSTFVHEIKSMSHRLGPIVKTQNEYNEPLLSGSNVYVKDLSLASLQGNWSARGQFSNNDRGNNRYNPYKNKRQERDYRRKDERGQSDNSQHRNYRDNNQRNYRNHKY